MFTPANRAVSRRAADGSRFHRQEMKSPTIRRDGSEAWASSVRKPAEDDSSTEMLPLLVPEKVAAGMLGVSPRTIWKLGKEGKLAVGRIGRRKNYLVSSLKAYAEKIVEVG